MMAGNPGDESTVISEERFTHVPSLIYPLELHSGSCKISHVGIPELQTNL